MTGAEAKEKGFADEVIEGEKLEIAASADLRRLYVNGRMMTFTVPLMNLPDTIPTYNPEAEANGVSAKKEPLASPEGENEGQEGGIVMAKTLEELRKENPELAESVLTEAKAAAKPDIEKAIADERKRLQEIDEISAAIDPSLVRAAKYDAPCSAAELALMAMKKQAEKGQAFVADLQADAQASGVQGVKPTPNSGEVIAEDEKKKKTEAAVDEGVKAAKEALKLVEGGR